MLIHTATTTTTTATATATATTTTATTTTTTTTTTMNTKIDAVSGLRSQKQLDGAEPSDLLPLPHGLLSCQTRLSGPAQGLRFRV